MFADVFSGCFVFVVVFRPALTPYFALWPGFDRGFFEWLSDPRDR